MGIRLLYKIAVNAFNHLQETPRYDFGNGLVPYYSRGPLSAKKNNKPLNESIEVPDVGWGPNTKIDQANVEGIAYPGMDMADFQIESAW